MWRLAIALLALFAATAAGAVSGPPKRVALVIGNWDYNTNGRFDDTAPLGTAHDLHSSCNDADHIRKALVSKAFEVEYLCNQSRMQWNTAMARFAEATSDVPDRSIVFLYYSGHGLQYNGYAFTVPVDFRLDGPAFEAKLPAARLAELRARANDLTRALERLNVNPKVAVIVTIDACRDSPLPTDDPAYNRSVSMLVPPNALIQYATTPGNRLPDSTNDLSNYSRVLADALDRGREIGDAMSQVAARIWKQYLAGGTGEAYADMNVGPAFQSLRAVPIAGTLPPAVPIANRPPPAISTPPGGAIVRVKQVIRVAEDGVRFDVLWCEGDDEAAHYRYAMAFAKNVAARAREFGVGRVQVKILKTSVNPQGYNVRRNLMRYDPADPQERALLIRVASAFPEGNFLPQQGIGVGGRPTWHYVSAFVCGRTGIEEGALSTP